MYITHIRGVVRIHIKNRQMLWIGDANKTGYKDGPFANALFNSANGLVMIHEHVLLVCDTCNHAIRIVDLKQGTVETLVGGVNDSQDGAFQSASFSFPLKMCHVPSIACCFVAENTNRIRVLHLANRYVDCLLTYLHHQSCHIANLGHDYSCFPFCSHCQAKRTRNCRNVCCRCWHPLPCQTCFTSKLLTQKKMSNNNTEQPPLKKQRISATISPDTFYSTTTVATPSPPKIKATAFPTNEEVTEKRKQVQPCFIFRKLDEAMQFRSNNLAFKLFSFQWDKGMFAIAKQWFSNFEECMLQQPNYQERYFIKCVSYDSFWRWYQFRMPAPCRHFYEIVPHKHACHLYMDIEVCKKDNDNMVMNEDWNFAPSCVQSIVELINVELQAVFQVQARLEDVVDLDSSTSAKFSKHLIFHLYRMVVDENDEDGYAERVPCVFADNIQMGQFLKQWIEKLKSSTDLADEHRAMLFVKKHATDEEATSCIIDQAVYSKNRAFRIYLSSKLGSPERIFVKSSNSQFFHDTEEELFMESLICNIPEGTEYEEK